MNTRAIAVGGALLVTATLLTGCGGGASAQCERAVFYVELYSERVPALKTELANAQSDPALPPSSIAQLRWAIEDAEKERASWNQSRMKHC